MADRRFSRWWPFGSSSADETPAPFLHMFIQDVQARIMPYRRGPSSAELGAVFKGSEQDSRVLTLLCVGLGEHSSIHDSPLELVSGAVRRVSQYLLWRGSVAFELPNVLEPSGEEPLSSLSPRSVRPITGELLFRLPGRVIGMRTAKRREWEEALPVIVSRPPKTVWRVSMPRTLGGESGYISVRRRLDKYPLTVPDWAPRSIGTEHQRVRFDVAAYRRLNSAYVARSSGPFSWDGRDTSLEHQTEFFLFYRTLTFYHALALLRQHIVDSFNRMVARQLELNARVVLTGFRQPDDILETRRRMDRGEISFVEAVNQVKF